VSKIDDAYEYLAEAVPDNQALIPLAFSLEVEVDEETGKETQAWWAYLAVKNPFWGDVDAAASHPKLDEALKAVVAQMRRLLTPRITI
jgi:hypothetical protein